MIVRFLLPSKKLSRRVEDFEDFVKKKKVYDCCNADSWIEAECVHYVDYCFIVICCCQIPNVLLFPFFSLMRCEKKKKNQRT